MSAVADKGEIFQTYSSNTILKGSIFTLFSYL